MGCKVAENQPLVNLRIALGIKDTCHSTRPDCIRGISTAKAGASETVLTEPGAVIGYCQAMFSRDGTPAEHTIKVARNLKAIDAPWSSSHELFLDHAGAMPIEEFLNGAMRPLAGKGRVPIVITGLDPAKDLSRIDELDRSKVPFASNETALFRVMISGRESLTAIAQFMNQKVEGCRKSQTMPVWWPLLQFDSRTNLSDWKYFKGLVGENWKYLNTAVNPFTIRDCPEIFEFVKNQVTVAQIPVGKAAGVDNSGGIQIPSIMKITGTNGDDNYSLPDYASRLEEALPYSPTLILLGAHQREWGAEEDLARVKAIMPHVKSAAQQLWGLNQERTQALMRLPA